MLELATLQFKTETADLDKVIDKIQTIKQEIAGIKPMKNPLVDGGTGSSASSGGGSGGRRRAAKEEAEGVSAVTKAIEKKTETLKVMRNQEIEAADGTIRLGDAFTRSQSSALAMLKILGATTAELKQMATVFNDMNAIMGVDPFDKSAGNLRSMRKEVEELNYVNRLMANGINLSKKEIQGLSRDIVRVTETMKAEGTTAADLAKAVQRLTTETVALSRAKAIEEQQLKSMEAARAAEAKKALDAETLKKEAIARTTAAMEKQEAMIARTNAKVGFMEQGFSVGASSQAATMKMAGVSDAEINTFLQRMKQLEDASKAARKAEAERAREAKNNAEGNSDAHKKAAAAAEWLRLTEERLATQLNETDNAMRKQYTDTLVKLRENLNRSGLSAAEAEAKYKRLEGMIRQVASKENVRNLDNLARAVSVQMGDVAISLASGMNPLLVLIQQGDQIRGAIQQSGVAGKQLQETMFVAAKQIASSFVMAGQAIGGFFTGAINAAGTAGLNFGAKMLGLTKMLTAWEASAEISAAAGNKLNMVLFNLARTIVGIGIGAAASGLLFLAVGAFQAMRENDKLARSLALTNGALEITHDQAFAAAAAFEAAGGNAGKFLTVLSEAGKTGELTAAQVNLIAEAVINLEKYGGVAIADTVKKFADLQKDPVDALAKLQKETGMVTRALFDQVEALAKVGREYEAGQLAVQEYARISAEQADMIKGEYTGLGLAVIETLSAMGNAWDKFIEGVWRKSGSSDAIVSSLQEQITYLEQAYAARGFQVMGPDKEKLASLKSQLRARQQALDLMNIENGKRREQDILEKEAREARIKGLSSEERIYQRITEYAIKIGQAQNPQDKETFHKLMLRQYKELEDLRKPKSGGNKEKSQFEKDMEVFNDLLQNAEGNTNRFNNQIASLERLLVSKEFSKVIGNDAEAVRKLVAAFKELESQQPGFKEAQKQKEEYLKRVTKETTQYEDAIRKLEQSQIDAISAEYEQADAMMYSIDMLRISSLEQEKFNKLIKAGIEYRKEIAKIERLYDEGDPRKAEAMQAAANIYAERVKNALSEAHIKSIKDYIEYFNDISKSLSDVVATALIDGGRESRKKLRDLIVSELRKKITLQIDAVINPIVQQIGGFMTGTASGSANNDAVASSAALFAKSLSKAIGPALLSYGALQDFYNQGFRGAGSREAVKSNPMLAPSAGINNRLADAMKGIGISDKVADILSGSVLKSRLFGRSGPQVTAAGIEGTFGPGGFQGRGFTDVLQKGGVFRRDKRSTQFSSLDAGVTQGLSSSFEQVTSGIKEMAETLGLGTEALSTFTYTTRLNLQGLSDDEAAKAIEEEFKRISDAMASSIGGLQQFQRYGESSSETLTRLSNVLGQMNEAMGLLNWSMYETSLSGFSAADSFVNLFGSLDEATSSLNRYYEDFYTAQEKTANVVEMVAKEFNKLGLTVPTTKEGFRQLVESIKATGNKQLLADVLKLSGSFSDMITVQEEFLSDYTQLQKRLLELQGDINGLRELELKGLDATAASLQKQIWLLEDLQEAQEKFSASLKEIEKNYADAQQAVKAAEEKVKDIRDRATDRYVAAVERVASATARISEIQNALRETYAASAKALREYIAEQSGGGKSFDELVALAKTGNLDAINSLSSSADERIQKGFDVASTREQALANRSRILAQVSEVAAVLESYNGSSLEEQILSTNKDMIEANKELLDANKELADALKVVTTIGAALVQVPQDLVAEFNAAIRELNNAVTFENAMFAALNNIKAATEAVAENTNDLSPALQMFAQKVLTDVITTVNVVATSNLPDDLRALALAGNSVLERTVKFVVEDSSLSEDDRKILLSQTQSVAKTYQLIADSSMLSDNEKAVLLNANSAASRLVEINAKLSENLTPEQKSVLAMSNDVVTKTVKQVVESGVLTNDQRSLLNSITETVTKITDLGINDNGLTAEQKALFNLLGQTNASANVVVGGAVTWTFDRIVKEVLDRIAQATERTADTIRNVPGVGPLGPIQVPGVTIPGGPTVPTTPTIPNPFNPDIPVQEFATGGVFTNTVVSRPTEFSIGRMAEAGPEAIMPLGRTANGSLGVVANTSANEELLEEIKILNRKVEELEAAARATAQTNSKIAKILERVTPDGESLSVTTI